MLTLIDLIKMASSASVTLPADKAMVGHQRVAKPKKNKVMPWASGRKPPVRLSKTAGLNYSRLGQPPSGSGNSYFNLGRSLSLGNAQDSQSMARDIFNHTVDSAVNSYGDFRTPGSLFGRSFPALTANLDKARARANVTGSNAQRAGRGFWGRLFKGDFEGAHDVSVGGWENMAGGGYRNAAPTSRQNLGVLGATARDASWFVPGVGATGTGVAGKGLAMARNAYPAVASEIVSDRVAGEAPGVVRTMATLATAPMANRQTRATAADIRMMNMQKFINAVGDARAQEVYPHDYEVYRAASPQYRAEMMNRMRAKGYLR